MREVICGKPNCRCKRGKPHGPYPYLALASKKTKRTISIYLSQSEIQNIKKKLENYQKLKEDIEELIILEQKIKKFSKT